MPEQSRQSDWAYTQAHRLSAICRESANRAEALESVRKEFPNEDLTELVKNIAPYLALRP